MENNPYATPEADLIANTGSEKDLSNTFVRFGWGWTLLLALITNGIYSMYWIYTRTTAINNVVDKKISSTLVGAYIVSSLILISADIYMRFNSTPVDIFWAFFGIAALVYVVSIITWIFTFRARLNDMIDAGELNTSRLGPVLSFFFNIIYFQFKINQAIDNS